MNHITMSSISCVLLLGCALACGDSGAASEPSAVTSSGAAGSSTLQPTAAAGAKAAAPAGTAAPAQPAVAGARAPTPSAGTTGTISAQAGTGGQPAALAGASGAAGSGSVGGTGGATVAGQGAAGAVGSTDTKSFASGLSELFLDVACDSATRAPLAEGATCNHPPGTQRIEKLLTFGGESGKRYKVSLRVRGIWEPTSVTGGMRPDADVPFTIGGQVASGAGSSSDSINYQQYFIEVAEPKQTYWLNDHQYVAHDIHKEDYEASLTVAGGSQIKVVMNDGNEREIANFPKEMFTDIPPYDKTPSLGQLLRLDVMSVEPAP